MIVRDYAEKDFEVLCDMNYQLMQAHKARTLMPFKFDKGKEAATEEVTAELSNGSIILIAETELGKPIGMCAIDPKDIPGKVQVPEIHWLYVKHDYCGRGVGTLLIRTAIERMKKEFPNAPGYTIGAEYWNEAAWKLYQKLGFEPQSIRLYYSNMLIPDEKIYK